MAHWFGISPADVDEMPYGELSEFLRRLADLPPMGATFVVERKGR